LDCDLEILKEARKRLKEFEHRVLIEHGNFSEVLKIFSAFIGRTDGVIMDLGLSSLQLNRWNRGFSIFRDGPLDFRMDTTQSRTGRDLVNQGTPEELRFAIGTLGEEPKVRSIVKAVLEERQKRPLLHTSDLRRVVEKVYGRKGGRIHPATQTFQGIRMWVNRELERLEEGVAHAFHLLRSGGRLAVISFHSGEDRIVKAFMKGCAERGKAEPVNLKPIRPGKSEIRMNPRSRSARLRVLARI
jgi:16S rRNA (cytosine1402-N4)-methyltransferase